MTDPQKKQQDEIPLLTFNSLYNILRTEKKEKNLQSLPQRFYEALSNFIEEKTKEIEKLKQNNLKDKIKKEKNILSNTKKIILEILTQRSLKIANIAIKNEIFKEKILMEKNILKEEANLFSSIQKATSSLKNQIK